MTELKTLKDFWERAGDIDPDYDQICDVKLIREEAIKHYKSNLENVQTEKLQENPGWHYILCWEDRNIWIKYFFNLTEEEIK